MIEFDESDVEEKGTCSECKEECYVEEVDDSFDYSGTHCTGGVGGTHVLVSFVSDCCQARIN